MTKIKVLCAAIMATVWCCTASAQNYNNVYFFGDSSTDSGSLAGTTYLGQNVWGKFTSYGGTMWSENVGAALGFAVTPHYQASAFSLNPAFSQTGGNNFAIGGARVDLMPGNGITTSRSVSMQVADAIASGNGRLDPSALYFIRAGANDLALAWAAGGNSVTPAGIASMTTAGQSAAAQVQALRAAGARYIIFANMGLYANGSVLEPLVNAYHTAYGNAIQAAGIPALQADLTGLMHDVFANYTNYGFVSNARFNPNRVCTYINPANQNAATCDGLVAPGADTQYIFADAQSHFSSGVMRIQSDYVLSLLRAPQQAALLAELPLTFSQQTTDVVTGRQRLLFDGVAPRDGNNLYIVGNYGHINYDAMNGMSNKVTDDSYSFTLGYDRAFGNIQAGAALSSYDVKPSIGFGGNIKTRGLLGSVYGTLPVGNFYVGGLLAYGSYDQSINRVIPLGIVNRAETGSTDASQSAAQINAGYLFRGEDWYHGPRAEFTYSRVKVNAFVENSGTFSAIRYGSQTLESKLASVGYIGSMRLPGMPFRLYGSLAYAKDLENSDRFVQIGVVTTVGDLPLPVGRDNKGYWKSSIGLSGEVAKNLLLSGQIGLNSSGAHLTNTASISLNWTGW